MNDVLVGLATVVACLVLGAAAVAIWTSERDPIDRGKP